LLCPKILSSTLLYNFFNHIVLNVFKIFILFTIIHSTFSIISKGNFLSLQKHLIKFSAFMLSFHYKISTN